MLRLCRATVLLACALIVITGCRRAPVQSRPQPEAGSLHQAETNLPEPDAATCRSCHVDFIGSWSASAHGRTIRHPSAEQLRARLGAVDTEVAAAGSRFRVVVDEAGARITEIGPSPPEVLKITEVLGSGNELYFLTVLLGRRWQMLPVAVNTETNTWFDATLKTNRHFAAGAAASCEPKAPTSGIRTAIRPPQRSPQPDGAGPRPEPAAPAAAAGGTALSWTEQTAIFTTSCFGCHMGQRSIIYDVPIKTYKARWDSIGLECAVCHGPGGEHVQLQEGSDTTPQREHAIFELESFTSDQVTAVCGSCHASRTPISPAFQPGDPFFDHFDLIGLESDRFYPDGRDRAEAFTLTRWMSGACARSGELDCLHCHTAGGEFRYSDEPRRACLPCHANKVRDPSGHSHHPEGSTASSCLSCHMPSIEVEGSYHLDHSMLPPTPATSELYGSPDACTFCHADRDDLWADRWVREWYDNDYQRPFLEQAALIDSARRQLWSRLPEMLAFIDREDRPAIQAAALIRLLEGGTSPDVIPVLIDALSDDPSPLVRASAAQALSAHPSRRTSSALIAALRDPSRLVRQRAATSVAALPDEMLTDREKRQLERAATEVEQSLLSRPDDASAHFELGNFRLDRGHLEEAVTSYEIAAQLAPHDVQPLVNMALAYNLMGRKDAAEQSLRLAIEREPNNQVASLNLGTLLNELGMRDRAEAAFRASLHADPSSAQAAYNLSILVSTDHLDEAIALARRATKLRPDVPDYNLAVALLLWRQNDAAGAARELESLIDRHPDFPEAYMLLGKIYETEKQRDKLRDLLKRGASARELSADLRSFHARRLTELGLD